MDKTHKIARTFAAVSVGVGVMLGFGSFAYATPADPTDGAMSTLESSISDWVTTYGIPSLVALLTIGLVVGILVRFAKRGARAVSGS